MLNYKKIVKLRERIFKEAVEELKPATIDFAFHNLVEIRLQTLILTQAHTKDDIIREIDGEIGEKRSLKKKR